MAAVAGAAPAAAQTTCVAAGTTGLTAKIVAHSAQKIRNQDIDATGCDVGIYVPPAAVNVVIYGNSVYNANDHGIFAQDARNVFILNNDVYDNGEAQVTSDNAELIAENKAIELVGTNGALVVGNHVYDNMVDGGIGLSDDGPIDPGAPNPGNLNPAINNFISGNQVYSNSGGCGIVLAAYNPGGGVNNNTVSGNNVYDNNSVPVVVAADPPGTSATGNKVIGNRITDNAGPGVVVHSNAPGDTVDGTVITGNSISNNAGLGGPDDQNTGVALLGEVNPVTNTTITFNSISNEYYGVFIMNDNGTSTIFANLFNGDTYNVYYY